MENCTQYRRYSNVKEWQEAKEKIVDYVGRSAIQCDFEHHEEPDQN